MQHEEEIAKELNIVATETSPKLCHTKRERGKEGINEVENGKHSIYDCQGLQQVASVTKNEPTAVYQDIGYMVKTMTYPLYPNTTLKRKVQSEMKSSLGKNKKQSAKGFILSCQHPLSESALNIIQIYFNMKVLSSAKKQYGFSK